MNCHESQELLDGYFDGEFDLRTSLDVEEHLRSCAICQSEIEELKKLKEVLSESDLYFRAPLELRKRVLASVRKSRTPWWGSTLGWTWVWPGSAIAAALAIILVFAVRPADSRMEDAVLAAHLRALEPNHLIDVVSTDSHTVKPWFNGKVDFSPPVVELKARGFQLVGGRLDYLYRDSAAALIYKRREHVVDLFLWPAAGPDVGPRSETLRGYHLIEWTRSGFRYWAISDLNMTELSEFERLLW